MIVIMVVMKCSSGSGNCSGMSSGGSVDVSGGSGNCSGMSSGEGNVDASWAGNSTSLRFLVNEND